MNTIGWAILIAAVCWDCKTNTSENGKFIGGIIFLFALGMMFISTLWR